MARNGGRIVATIEARMTSSRLPGKVLKPCLGRPMLELMIERVRRAPSLSGVVVCTTTNPADDPVVELCERLKVWYWRGSEEDVLQRVLHGAQMHGIDTIVELTGDCPLIDPALIEETISAYLKAGVDYCSNALVRSYPIGMDTQVFATKVLADVDSRTKDPVDHEHVSLYIYRHPELYSLKAVEAPPALRLPEMRLTLDTPEDLALITAVFERLAPTKPAFDLADVLAVLDSEPALKALNAHVQHRYV
jgi:spore coat polysaccharide biosynthesis protein SpsF